MRWSCSHIWNKFGVTMAQFSKDIKAAMDSGTGNSEDVSSYTKIMGKAAATAEQMQECIKKKNPRNRALRFLPVCGYVRPEQFCRDGRDAERQERAVLNRHCKVSK